LLQGCFLAAQAGVLLNWKCYDCSLAKSKQNCDVNRYSKATTKSMIPVMSLEGEEL
jgi:hypothetical protein